MSDPQAVVIGAGPAGLAAAAELGRRGVKAAVLDRADEVAASWRSRYDRLKLNTGIWTSKLPGAKYARGTPFFPTRDEVVAYLERYAEANELDLRLGTQVDRIDRENSRWVLRTSSGEIATDQVVVAIGYQHTPAIPDWPGRDRFSGNLIHAAEYRNSEPFRDRDVLVVGPGCSGMEIAYDLATGGARHSWLAVRTPPNIILRSGRPAGDYPALAMMRLPPKVADAQMKVLRRLQLGDLTDYGLPPSERGLFTRLKDENKVPAIVDKEVIKAIKNREIEIVGSVESLDETSVRLADGTRIEPDAVIAATGYRAGLEPLVGHLDVLDERGMPQVHGGMPAAPGLHFIGYTPLPGQIGYMGREATRVAKSVAREARAPAPAG